MLGLQRQLLPGMVLSVDYLRNVNLHYLIGVDVNHSGDTRFFNKTAAQQAIYLHAQCMRRRDDRCCYCFLSWPASSLRRKSCRWRHDV